jgi:hypothetical protein
MSVLYNPFETRADGAPAKMNFPDFDAALMGEGTSDSSDVTGESIGTLARQRPVEISISSGAVGSLGSEHERELQEECQRFFEERESSSSGEVAHSAHTN